MQARVVNNILKKPKFARNLSTALQQETNSDVVEYPPIYDISSQAKRNRYIMSIQDKVKRCPSIEEKIIQLNMPKYYGFKCLLLNDSKYPYNTLPFIQYITKTEFQNLPSIGEEESKAIDIFLNLIKSEFLDALEFELDALKIAARNPELQRVRLEEMKASRIVKQLNRALINTLGADNRHLYELDVDISPRIEAFWFVGGIVPPLNAVRLRRRHPYKKTFANDPVLRGMQYVGRPIATLRHQYPLKPFVDMNYDELTAQNENVPNEEIAKVDPTAYGWSNVHRHGVTVPGFWPGNVREYGLLSFYSRKHLLTRPPSFGEEDKKLALHAQAITTAFSWLFGQATYQGFSTFNDITYPLASQNVITDGQNWSFYRYQMNTTVTYSNVDGPNYKFNQCWGTDEMKLFEDVDEKGKVHGFNDDVLRRLIQFYINQPQQRDYEMKPYLDPNEKKIADIQDVDRRQWLERTFKTLVSNRPRHHRTPEVYSWEKIYKIDNKTRPMDKKRRFFELDINPFDRRLNEHYPEYIPRALRAGGIYDKKKLRPTYYPFDHRSNDPKTMSLSLFGAAAWGIRRKFDRWKKSFQ